MIGLTQAAETTGKRRQTIHKAIKTGRISANKNEKGEWEIDPAELLRVYPPKSTVDDNQNQKLDASLQRDMQLVDSGLRREIELLREQLEREREISADLARQRDRWEQQATALLTDQRNKEAPTLWQWLGVTKSG